MRKLLPVIVVAITAVALLWFFSAHRADLDSPLAHVPADTPYVLGILEPMPERVRALSLRQARLLAPAYASKFDEIRGRLPEMLGEPRIAALLDALAEEFRGMDPEAALAEAGLDWGGRMLVYGNGLLPVLRAELAEPDRFAALLGRLEARSGLLLPQAELDGRRYWHAGSARMPVAAIAAVIDDELVIALMPRGSDDAMLRQALGLERPQRSLADSGEVRELARRFDYLPQFIGYIDSHRLVDALQSPGDAERLLAMTSGWPWPVEDSRCDAELRALADVWPRASVGFTQLDDKRQHARFVIATEPALAESLRELRAPMPGLAGVDETSMVHWGISMRGPAMSRLLHRHAQAVAATPWQCPALAPLNEGFQHLASLLENPAVYVAASFTNGVHINLTGDGTQRGVPGEQSSGVLVVASEQPSVLLAVAQGMFPGLAGLEFEPDGPPRALRAVGGQPMFVAMTDSAIAFSLGADQHAHLLEALKHDDSRQPVFVAGMGSAAYPYRELYRSIIDGTRAAAGPGAAGDADGPFDTPDALDPQRLRDQDRLYDAYAGLFDRMSWRIEFTAHGIEIHHTTALH